MEESGNVGDCDSASKDGEDTGGGDSENENNN